MGKGLQSSANGNNGAPKPFEKVVPIPVEEIMPDPEQPRRFFDPEKLRELGQGIKQGRQVQAVIICPIKGQKAPIKYMLVGGERRWRAHRMATLPTINAIIRTYASDLERESESVTDNTGREDVDDIDMGLKLKRMQEKHKLTIAQLAKIASADDSWVQQRLSLTTLHPDLQKRMGRDVPEEDRIIFSVGIRLAAFPHERQLELDREIVSKKMRMKEALHLIRMAAANGQGIRQVERSPNRDRHMVINSIDRIAKDLKFFLSMKGNMFNRSFGNQTRFERRVFIESLDRVKADLDMMREEISSLPCSDDAQPKAR